MTRNAERKLHTDGDDDIFVDPALVALIEGLATEGDSSSSPLPEPQTPPAPSRFKKFN